MFLNNKLRSAALHSACVGMVLGMAGMAIADEDSDSGVTSLEEVTVTATRREESLMEVPISIATLDGERLDSLFSGGEDVLALSGRVPGLYLESSNGRSAPRFYVRGLGNIDFDLAASQPVSYIMDDVVLENVVLKSFPLFDIDQVEVMRGPQGSLFGRNTTAGIVKVSTRRPTEENEGFAAVSYGSYGTMDIEAAMGGQFIGDTTARFSVLYRKRDNWINNGFTGQDDAMGNYDEKAARLQLQWAPGDNFRGLLMMQGRQLEGTASIFRANIFNTGSNELNRNYRRDTVYFDGGDNNPQEYDGRGVTLNLEWMFDNGASFTSITSVQSADGYSRGDIDGGVVDFSGAATPPPGIDYDPAAPVFGCCPTPTFPGTIIIPSVTQDGADTDQVTQEFRLASSPEGPLTWQAGFYYFDSSLKVETESFASFGFASVQNTIVRHDNSAWAVFGQGSYQFTDRFKLTAGLRYTDDKRDYEVAQFGQLWLDLGIPEFIAPPTSVSDEAVSWDLAASFDLGESSLLYGRVASGFRGPTIQGRDVAFLETPTVADSETVVSYEVGYKADLMDNRMRLSAALFHYTVDDIQLSIIGGASNSNQVINASKAEATGLELDMQVLPTDNLLLTFGFAYNDTEIKDPDLYVVPCGSGLCEAYGWRNANGQVSINGNPLPRTPKSNWNLTARWAIPFGDSREFYVFTDWTWYGEILMPLYYSPEFVTNDQIDGGIKFGMRDNRHNWDLALFGRNITDEDNVKGFIDFSNNTGFVNEPRIWGLEFRKDFGL